MGRCIVSRNTQGGMARIVLLVVLACCVAMGAWAAPGAEAPGAQAGTSRPGTTAPWMGDTPMKVTFLYADNGGYPFNKDWLVLTELKKRTNVDLQFTVVADADYGTKLNLLFASGDLPDVISKANLYLEPAQNGLLLAVDDYAKDTPNFWAMAKKYGKDTMTGIDNLRLKENNKLYVLPGLVPGGAAWQSGIMIRADVLKKYGMDKPKTADDFYKVLARYKQDNPQSVPFTELYGQDGLLYWTSPAFREFIPQNWGCPEGIYYDHDAQKFVFAADSPKTKQLITYLAKLMKDGLLDPESFNQNSDQWNQKMINGVSIATYGWVGMDTGLLEGGKKVTPDYDLTWIPNIAGLPGQSGYVEGVSTTRIGYAFPSRLAKDSRVNKILQLIDWASYSDEGRFLFQYGVAGVTANKDNSGKWIPIDEILKGGVGNAKYGLNNNAFGNVCPSADLVAMAAPPNVATLNRYIVDNKMVQPVAPVAKFTADETEAKKLFVAPLTDYFYKEVTKFIFGTRNVATEWDAFVKECRDKGSDKLTVMYNKAIGK